VNDVNLVTLAVACPSCGTKFKVSQRAAGKKARCPKCQVPFIAPGLSGLWPTHAAVESDPCCS
jgi:predicted Zn finger-like uncharacterized protein